MIEIKSEIYKGLIYNDGRDLASTIDFEILEPNQLVVKAGTLTLQGRIYEVEQVVFVFSRDGVYQVALGRIDGVEVVAAYSPLMPPNNWDYIQQLAGYGPGVIVQNGTITDDVYVLRVVDGVPPEQTEEEEFLLENTS
jgi:hypothetical protein